MVLYLFFSIFFTLFAIIEIYKENLDGRKFLITLATLFVVFLIFVGGLRYYVGADYGSYMGVFKETAKRSSIEEAYRKSGEIESGYVIVNYLFRFTDYAVFLLIFTAFSVGLKYRFILRYAPYVFLALLLYLPTFLEGDMGIIRQYFALGLMLWSIDFIIKRNFLKFCLVLLLAFQFHRTSIMFLPAFWIPRIKFNYWFGFIVILILQIMPMGGLTELILQMANINAHIYAKLMDYASNGVQIVGFGIKDVARLLVVLFLALNYKYFKDDKRILAIANIFMFGCFVYTLLKVTPFGQRLTLYYLRTEIVLIPMVLYQICQHEKSRIKIGLSKIFVIVYSVVVLTYKIIILIPFNENYQFVFWHK